MHAAGVQQLKEWQGRRLDGFELWGLHNSACAELAEAAGLCVEQLDSFGIELNGRAAVKVGSQLPADAFSSVADYLQSKVRGAPVLAALICLTCAIGCQSILCNACPVLVLACCWRWGQVQQT